MNRRAITLSKLATLTLVMLAGSAHAGPLSPPVGPVGSTGKTTQEIFDKAAAAETRIAINAANTPQGASSKFKITQPGSYYLPRNESVFNIINGIEIALTTEGVVTIDLNGYTLSGNEGTLSGIKITGPFQPRVTIRNGHVTAFEGNGIDMTGTESATIENVECTRNSGKGFIIGSGSLTNCKAQFNSAGGFKTGDGASLIGCEAVTTALGFETGDECRFVDCTVKGSNTHGFRVGDDSVLTRCIAMNNAGTGIYVDLGCTLRDCVASENAQAGISTNQLCTLVGCTARENTQWGISSVDSNLEGCTARDNGFQGFSVSYCTVRGCVSNANSGVGFSLGAHSTLVESSAQGNTGGGVDGGGDCLIENCRFTYNYGHGIYLSHSVNVIRGNLIVGSGYGPGGSYDAAGIYLTLNSNRVEDNHCTDGDRGIHVVGTRNIIVRNSCAGNTQNWVIGASNSYGPVIDRSAAVTAGFSGNSAVSTMGSTDPNANFTN